MCICSCCLLFGAYYIGKETDKVVHKIASSIKIYEINDTTGKNSLVFEAQLYNNYGALTPPLWMCKKGSSYKFIITY